MMEHTLTKILLQSLAIFLLIFALAGIAVSLLLIFKPHLMARINLIFSHWITTRHMSQFMDRSFSIEQWFYRHHSAFGLFIILGACYILVHFSLLFDKSVALQHLSHYAPRWKLNALMDALVLISLICAVVALLVGLFLWLRPSLLRGIEEETNKWISTRRATRFLEIPRDDVESFVAKHSQRVGWLLLMGSLYLLVTLLRILM